MQARIDQLTRPLEMGITPRSVRRFFLVSSLIIIDLSWFSWDSGWPIPFGLKLGSPGFTNTRAPPLLSTNTWFSFLLRSGSSFFGCLVYMNSKIFLQGCMSMPGYSMPAPLGWSSLSLSPSSSPALSSRGPGSSYRGCSSVLM